MIRCQCACGEEMEPTLWRTHDEGTDVAFTCLICGVVLSGIVTDPIEQANRTGDEVPEGCHSIRTLEGDEGDWQ